LQHLIYPFGVSAYKKIQNIKTFNIKTNTKVKTEFVLLEGPTNLIIARIVEAKAKNNEVKSIF
jgi:hypothetical protein